MTNDQRRSDDRPTINGETRHGERVLTRKQNYNRVWGYGCCGESTMIEVYVPTLRPKLEASVSRCCWKPSVTSAISCERVSARSSRQYTGTPAAPGCATRSMACRSQFRRVITSSAVQCPVADSDDACRYSWSRSALHLTGLTDRLRRRCTTGSILGRNDTASLESRRQSSAQLNSFPYRAGTGDEFAASESVSCAPSGRGNDAKPFVTLERYVIGRSGDCGSDA